MVLNSQHDALIRSIVDSQGNTNNSIHSTGSGSTACGGGGDSTTTRDWYTSAANSLPTGANAGAESESSTGAGSSCWTTAPAVRLPPSAASIAGGVDRLLLERRTSVELEFHDGGVASSCSKGKSMGTAIYSDSKIISMTVITAIALPSGNRCKRTRFRVA